MPITTSKEDIINAVNKNDVTIITAETGSGKSTQVPQYLAECGYSVIVTQPRIMAAKTLAARVSFEMNVQLGHEVGYRTGYDKCYSEQEGKICYVTDGLQLIKTIFEEDISKSRVLIIDEIHEWNLNMEVLVAWCKMMVGKWNTKVVIMSATMDTMELKDYFNNCKTSVISVVGKSFPVSVEGRSESDLIPAITENIKNGKNILVFVPGKREIAEITEKLEETNQDKNAVILPLHGELDWSEQAKCFENYSIPKVIVATNVAQTSITIPDIDVVIDTGKARITIAEDGIQGLFLKDISKADILQRKGRAGRTKEGTYILCSDTLLAKRDEYTVPEIQRSILSRVVLQLSAIKIDAETMDFFHQPPIESIKAAKKELIVLGAMDQECKITPMGHQISKIPLAVNLARMVVEAKKFGVVKPVITIASIVEMGGLLSKEGDYSNFTTESKSDLLAEFDVWQKLQELGIIDFEDKGINKKNFFRIKNHIKKLSSVLQKDFLILEDGRNYKDREAILKCCLIGWSHNVFIKSYFDRWTGTDEQDYRISRNSCTYCNAGMYPAIVGIPKIIEYKDRWSTNTKLLLVNFVTGLTKEQIFEMFPSEIVTKYDYEYDNDTDSVKVKTYKSFKGNPIETTFEIVSNHPRLEELRNEYRQEHSDWQKTVVIEGKEYPVLYSDWMPRVLLDEKTVNTMTTEEVFLENGRKVCLTCGYDSASTLSMLKHKMKLTNIRICENKLRAKVATLQASTLTKVIINKEYIGPIDISCGSAEKRFTYGGLVCDRNQYYFELFDSEDEAEKNTKEVLQILFMKEVERMYTPKKFSHLNTGKKKAKLTEEEKKTMEEFFKFAEEISANTTVDNCNENLEFLEEYFNELKNVFVA